MRRCVRDFVTSNLVATGTTDHDVKNRRGADQESVKSSSFTSDSLTLAADPAEGEAS